ncbi:flagellar biosynthesis protein FlhB [Myxococcota bacterium]|nr:flagellar biosynthesis protein FlhB [Myxococcota bacterium]MBU1429363.1 flagellar biosynthesis protein FlhB [Myxococcota bacterium]MBU1899886.1 flagellar biosynthesis protein FlhB [Myxococcota bacterium]
MSDDAGERTEAASEKRREEFREKGELARSQDLLSMLVLFSAFAYFSIGGAWIAERLGALLRHFLSLRGPQTLTVESVMGLITALSGQMGLLLAPLVGMIVLVGLLGNLAQVGFLWTTKPLEPDLNKLNFFAKFFSTFFNKQKLGLLVGSLAKISVVGLIVWLTLEGREVELRSLSTLPLLGALRYTLETIMAILLRVALALIIITIADYAWNRYVIEERMKMTKQEVKEESKSQEGSPEIKGKRRQKAMELAQRRMMGDVPTADVIINNPTHFSVALRYRHGIDPAPIIVAKGADLIAFQIRKIAKAHRVPMITNKRLARGLYADVEIGQPVPEDFYRAVAEVLAYIMRLKRSS